MIQGLLRLASQRQTYLNILYLLLSFPLGLIYFVLLITCIVCGLGTLIVWVGVPLLLFTMGMWWSLARFERIHAMSWLGVSIPPMKLPDTTPTPFWQKVRSYLSYSVTWKSLAYLLTKFFFGIIAFTITLSTLVLMLTISIMSLAIGLTLIPLCYLFFLLIGPLFQLRSFSLALLSLLWLATLICSIVFLVLLLVHGHSLASPDATEITFIVLFPCFLFVTGGLSWFVLTGFARSRRLAPVTIPFSARLKQWLLLSLTAYGLVLFPLPVFNTLAGLWGQFASVMLGMSTSALRVAEAEQTARLERAKAERAEQSRRELIVNVSHELRTPVASIRGHLESLLLSSEAEDRSLTPEALHNYLEIVYRESTRLGMLVDDLLSLARNDASELRVDLAAVNASEVVEEVYQTLMPLARRQRQITLVRTVTPSLPPVQADHRRLHQILLNLVRNAITYTPDGGIVSIMLLPAESGEVELQVADTGIGIPEADLTRIFERFYRTDASRARTSGGFGLGLAIVRDFVLAMGGSVSVESKVDEGTCFHVLLRPMASSSKNPQNPTGHLAQTQR
ncbi:MAG TPA: ATP-binding protein [Ktedonobacteraceae bacterium]|jgi:signal transduction histidine kinase|nr:ATP-binding protein [Ktedonobacteraceae bacterium]